MKHMINSRVTISDGDIIELSVSDTQADPDKIYVYKLSSLTAFIKEDNMSDHYIAVHNGCRVTVRNIPEGSYIISRI